MFSKNHLKFLSSLIFLLLVILIFGISVFKNISYPLLWNDEADTIMHGRRILEMGYPKVHDGKNVLDLTPNPDRGLAIKEEYDAMIGMPWGQYYFASLAEIFAQKSSDIYQKTAMLRIPFAVAGLIGLWLIGSAVSRLMFSRNRKRVFMTLYFILSALSVSLTLHLREARYYSLMILFVGLALLIFGRWYFENKSKFITYFILSSVSLFLLFNTYSPSYFIFVTAISLYAFIDLFIKIKKRQLVFLNFWNLIKQIIILPEFSFFLKSFAPMIFSLVYIIPLINFFEVFHIGNEIQRSLYFDYPHNLFYILDFFSRFEFLYLAVFSEILVLFFYFFRNMGQHKKIRKIFQFSNFLILFFIVHALIISRIPFLFERYFIVLIPVLNLLIVTNIFIIYEIFSVAEEPVRKKKIIFVLIFIFVLNLGNHEEALRGHWFEMNNIYKGPLDFAIPYLKEKYANPENLIIATNYEEYVFMYYLNAKVIVGYVGNNLQEDSQLNPDVIIVRKWHDSNLKTLQDMIQKNSYEKVFFDIYDSQVNNIPELYCPTYHLYKTKLPNSEKEKLEILVKQ